MVSDKQLVKIAEGFRAGMIGRESSAGTCFIICAPLAGLLSAYGIKGVRTQEGIVRTSKGETNHFWIVLPDGRVLDPTLDQFDPKLPPIYLGAPTKYHRILVPDAAAGREEPKVQPTTRTRR